jgi:hypothetical protein
MSGLKIENAQRPALACFVLLSVIRVEKGGIVNTIDIVEI